MVDFAPATGPDGFPRSGWTPPGAGVQLAPGGDAAARAAGYAAPAPAAQPGPAPDTAPSPAAVPPAPGPRAPVVRDLSGQATTEPYDLLWPKAVDGVEIRQVVLRRMSTGEVAAFVDRVRAGASDRFPIFYRTDGALLSDAEWDALDVDDTDALGERTRRFLPARFRAAKGSEASSPPAPAPTGSSSDGSPASA